MRVLGLEMDGSDHDYVNDVEQEEFAQGAWKLEHLATGAFFFPFLLVWLYLLRKSAYRDFLHIILKHTQ